jgi:hypothetical protein
MRIVSGLIAIVLLVGCGSEKLQPADAFLKNLHIDIDQTTYSKHPLWRDYTISITDPRGHAVNVDKITLKLDMHGMSHPKFATLERVGNGKYHVMNKQIRMAGDWYSAFSLYHAGHVLTIVKE